MTNEVITTVLFPKSDDFIRLDVVTDNSTVGEYFLRIIPIKAFCINEKIFDDLMKKTFKDNQENFDCVQEAMDVSYKMATSINLNIRALLTNGLAHYDQYANQDQIMQRFGTSTFFSNRSTGFIHFNPLASLMISVMGKTTVH